MRVDGGWMNERNQISVKEETGILKDLNYEE